MLTTDALAQLRQLKQQIVDQKEHASGTVRGTQGRFGFVVLDDGREIYLAAEQMQRVFPDDRINIEIITGADGKPVAQLEKLVSTELRTFTGQYVVRDNAHFVEPDLPRLSRWIFVPPKQRMNAKHGDYVRASISRHPFDDGRGQARVEKIIGDTSQKGFEASYALTRFGLPERALPLDENDLRDPDGAQRRDLTALPFVTIDGAETRDMDDALYAEVSPEGGWTVSVAIADPGAWIKPGSALETAIAARGSSIYLPLLTVPMLPEALANERCSLLPDVERLALVCELHIDASGAIARYEFSEARIRSCAKLSYDGVTKFLANPDAPASAWANSVQALAAASQQLQAQRARDHIVLPERGEYRAQYAENGKIAGYTRMEKNRAQQLVEECMVAVNRCAADFLKEHAAADEAALFVAHRGFRQERLDNVARLLAEQLPELGAIDARTLPGYVALMHHLAQQPPELPLREILFRSLERSQFSSQPEPHFGMGLPCYTTVTSPIRKFNDYLLQRTLKAKLRGERATPISAELIAQVQDCSDRARQAANLAQQWLDCDYLQLQVQRQPAQVYRAEIVHVTSSGIVVRLLDNGIQGMVDTRNSGEKFSFDSVYMRLSSPTKQFQLTEQVDVSVAAVDMKKRSVSFKLAATAEATAQPAQA